MTLAERLFWFKCDHGDMPCHPEVLVPTIDAQVGTLEFLNDTADYLLDIVADALTRIKRIGEPEGNYEQMVYDDLVETHNRAVDLFNDLMEGGITQ